jgi:hypothetical protein
MAIVCSSRSARRFDQMEPSMSEHRRLRPSAGWVLAWLALAVAVGCQQVVKPTAGPTRQQLAELWSEPAAGRDLFLGVGGRRLMPLATELFTVTEVKDSGFSDGYTLRDRRGREWSAKFPPEATTEVVASRLLWGLGYHQPPVYLLTDWRAAGAKDPNPQRPARFREKAPDLYGLTDTGSWSYYKNPFVDTPQLNGLHVMLGNSDLKDDQNALYTLNRPVEGARRWYVARDLGQTFGRTGLIDAPRGDIDAFEETAFVDRVVDGRVQFHYRGRHNALFDGITVTDVAWICRRLNRLTDRQWRDAFRAGGYDGELAQRFIRKMKTKIAEGLALSSSERSSP